MAICTDMNEFREAIQGYTIQGLGGHQSTLQKTRSGACETQVWA